MMTPAKSGRPKAQIDQKLFEELCAIHATEQEIADIFKCTVDTLSMWCKKTYNATFQETKSRLSANTKMNLRRKQLHMALVEGDSGQLNRLANHYLSDQKPQQPNVVINNNVGESATSQLLLAALKNLIEAKTNERQTIDLKTSPTDGDPTSYRLSPSQRK